MATTAAGKIYVIKLPPFQQCHVLDRNTQTTRLEVGPKTFRVDEHEQVVAGPEPMLVVPPRHYVLVESPVLRDPASGAVLVDAAGQARLAHGDVEARFEAQEPVALHPGERLRGPPRPFAVVAPNCALVLRAARDVGERRAGDTWLFCGPATYVPRVEVEVVAERAAQIVAPDAALRVAALRDCRDCEGRPRRAGEQWLVRTAGAYMQSVDERVVDTVRAIVLTPKRALRLRALQTCTDRFGRRHRTGEEWLVTAADCDAYIADVDEEVVGPVDVTALAASQYCVVVDPVEEAAADGDDEGRRRQLFGQRRLIRGPATFFLQPGEALERGAVQDVVVLGVDEALRVRCVEPFADERARNVRRVPGSEWLVCGPCEYVPPLEVRVLERIHAFVAIEALNFFIWDRRNVVTSAFLALLVLVLAVLVKLIF